MNGRRKIGPGIKKKKVVASSLSSPHIHNECKEGRNSTNISSEPEWFTEALKENNDKPHTEEELLISNDITKVASSRTRNANDRKVIKEWESSKRITDHEDLVASSSSSSSSTAAAAAASYEERHEIGFPLEIIGDPPKEKEKTYLDIKIANKHTVSKLLKELPRVLHQTQLSFTITKAVQECVANAEKNETLNTLRLFSEALYSRLNGDADADDDNNHIYSPVNNFHKIF